MSDKNGTGAKPKKKAPDENDKLQAGTLPLDPDEGLEPMPPPKKKGRLVKLPAPGESPAPEAPAEGGPSGPAPPDAPRLPPYFERDGRTFWRKPSGDGGSTEVQLANFTARIVGEVVEDDGANPSMRFELESSRGRFELTPAAFNAMSWPSEHVGASAIVAPGNGVRDRLRHAVQVLSGDVPQRRAFVHLGWTKLEREGWVYLHAGGAIGARGAAHGVGVRLADPHTRFELPAPPDGDRLRAAVRASLAMIDVAPRRVMFPLLAAAYRAPLGPCDFSVFVNGTTGSQKSCVAALCQQHYGAGMTYKGLPAGWSSSANANEALCFYAKDAVFTIDDFLLQGTAHDRARTNRDADRLIRGQANGTGRARLTADAGMGPMKFSRALILMTGEDLPTGASMRARMLAVDLGKGEVDLARLTEAQRDADQGTYALAMSGFLRWLAPRYDGVAGELRQQVTEERDRMREHGVHARAPEIAANLFQGIRAFAAFAEQVGALTAAEARQVMVDGRAALLEALGVQADAQREVDPLQRFFEALLSAIGQGLAHVAGADGQFPAEAPRAWGWRSDQDGRQESISGDDDGPAPRFEAQGPRIGWLWPDSEDLALDPDAALQVARRVIGDELALNKRTLGSHLKERGHLVLDSGGRASNKFRAPAEMVREGGSPNLVMRIRLSALRPVGLNPTNVGSGDREPTCASDCGAELFGGNVGLSGSGTHLETGPEFGGDRT